MCVLACAQQQIGTLAAAIHGHIVRVLASTPFTISQSEGEGGARLAIVNGIAQTCGVVKLSKKLQDWKVSQKRQETPAASKLTLSFIDPRYEWSIFSGPRFQTPPS